MGGELPSGPPARAVLDGVGDMLTPLRGRRVPAGRGCGCPRPALLLWRRRAPTSASHAGRAVNGRALLARAFRVWPKKREASGSVLGCGGWTPLWIEFLSA